MLEFQYQALPGRVVFGAGAARRELAGELDRLAAKRVLLVTGGSAEETARALADPLGERVVTVFAGVRPHVPLRVAEAARALAASVEADALLAVGGGSAVGTAKAIALTTGLAILAVPTTYAGSEMTSVWGLTENNRKTTGTDPRVLPATVIYDPELTVGLPARTSTASGLNAMAHCVEAFWAPDRNPVSTLAAREGIRALAEALPRVRHDPDAREGLLYGAYLAGSAFAVAGSGLHHKICHVLGGAYDLPHALTHAVVLPHVLAFNAPCAPEAAAAIAESLDGGHNGDNGNGGDPVARLRALNTELGVPCGLRALGLRADQVFEAAELVAPLVPEDNPRPVDLAALRGLIHAAWAGTRAEAGGGK
ncbi:maleylacetate reductase [Pseudonocardia eucalypti]|uniref:Maleylacetate reductase n=1 Tax=Pseudonocardia eucalypti TaxID=648755 RepID=A0ABP9Q9L5_9PSEU|nr:maleylacetate reductase [Pseudonocardia eucalypti]